MKKLVVYYSLGGSCRLVAEKIKDAVNADILEIKPKKEVNSKGFSKYLWGGKQVLMKETPELEDININLNEYDVIYIGTPVWAGTYAPAINSFLSKNKITNKKIVLFCCHSGGKGHVFEKLEEKLEGNNILSKKDFIEPIKKSKEQISNEISEWINKEGFNN